jgi:signal transduction histidine kinase
MISVKKFFLYRYKDASHLEMRKASYLFFITLASLSYISIIAAGQFYFNNDLLYKTALLIALSGILAALVLFRERRINVAGHLISCSMMGMIVFETCVHDYFSHDPAIRYSLYVSLVSLTAVCFIVVSFFRNQNYVLAYSVVFQIILLTHALIICHAIGDIPGMKLNVWQHFVTVSLGMAALGGISSWLLSYLKALSMQNEAYARHVESQRNTLEKMVTERTADLETSNQHLNEFAYLVSHDLKEPLRTISGFVTLIRRELESEGLNEGDISDYLNFVNTGTFQMEKLIRDILAYSKLNVIEKQFAPVNVEEILDDVKGKLAKSITESAAVIYVVSATPVLGQKLLLEQLFQNLISNAIKYRAPERPLVITIGCIKSAATVSCFVKDNGIGIDPEHYEAIFKPFKRLHSKVNYEGTGVGLAICKKIAEIHGGEIKVESNEAVGCTFWFTVPAAQSAFAVNQAVVQAA